MPPSIATLTIVFSSPQLAKCAVSVAAAQINPSTRITFAFVLTAPTSVNRSHLTNRKKLSVSVIHASGSHKLSHKLRPHFSCQHQKAKLMFDFNRDLH